MRKYLHIGLNIFAGTSAQNSDDFPKTVEWVESVARATVDISEKAKETQRKLSEFGIETHLLELLDFLHPGSRWVIYREDCEAANRDFGDKYSNPT